MHKILSDYFRNSTQWQYEKTRILTYEMIVLPHTHTSRHGSNIINLCLLIYLYSFMPFLISEYLYFSLVRDSVPIIVSQDGDDNQVNEVRTPACDEHSVINIP